MRQFTKDGLKAIQFNRMMKRLDASLQKQRAEYIRGAGKSSKAIKKGKDKK